MTKPQYSGPWQQVRATILARDRNLCQIKLIGCTTRATQVDHIIRVTDGGEWFEPGNLRAACAFCNRRREAHRTPQSAQPSRAW